MFRNLLKRIILAVINNRGEIDFGKKENETRVPKHEIESLARLFLPRMQEFFASEEGQREYAQWQAKRKAENV